GLDLAKRIVDAGERTKLDAELYRQREALRNETVRVEVVAQASEQRSAHVPAIEAPPRAPDFDLHVLRNTPLEHIWAFINPLMLYGRHLGLKGTWLRKL